MTTTPEFDYTTADTTGLGFDSLDDHLPELEHDVQRRRIGDIPMKARTIAGA